MGTVSQRVDEQNSVVLYDGKVHLDFDPVKHRYKINGNIAHGVTTILGIISKPFLIPWAANQAGAYVKANVVPGKTLDEVQIQELVDGARNAHKRSRDGAADMGSYVHNWIEEFVATGKQPEMPLNPKLKKVCEEFLNWWDTVMPEVIEPEKIFCSPTYMVAGTADLLCRIDGKLTIVDWKTGSGIYPEMFLQLAAYAMMHEEETGEKVEQLYVVNASIKNMFQTECRDEVDFYKETFVKALELYRANKQLEQMFR